MNFAFSMYRTVGYYLFFRVSHAILYCAYCSGAVYIQYRYRYVGALQRIG